MLLLSFSYQVLHEGAVFNFSKGYVFASAEVPLPESLSGKEVNAEVLGARFRKCLSLAKDKLEEAVLSYPVFPDARFSQVVSNQTRALLKLVISSARVSDISLDESRMRVEIAVPLYGESGLYHLLLEDENFKKIKASYLMTYRERCRNRSFKKIRSVRVEVPANITLPLFPVFVDGKGECLFSTALVAEGKILSSGPAVFLEVGEGFEGHVKQGKYADYIVLESPSIPAKSVFAKGTIFLIFGSRSSESDQQEGGN